MSEHPRHPGIPLSNTKIVPPYIPAPKKTWTHNVKTFTAEELESMKAEIELLHSQFNKAIYDQTLAENARLKAEVERLRKAGEWQPIETAPKDMTRVLGYVEEYIVVMWWFTYSNGRSCWETVDGESEVDPTHWMPLPKPPQEGKPSV